MCLSGLEKVSNTLHEKFPKANIIGTLGTTIALGGDSNKDIVIISFSQEDVTSSCGVLTEISKYPMKDYIKFEENIEKENKTSSR